jgi:radical SAM protein with 4Fe4S-binding SPASM domain
VIADQSYSQFSLAFHSQVDGVRLPLSGTIELTRRCPLDCQHCYNNLPLNDRAARDGEMTTAQHKRLVDQIVDEGCLWLLYSGGEILARPDFLEIYTYAKRKGLLITLFTNGTMVTPKVADALAEYRPFGVEVTLYGGSEATYERMTQVPGSFARCRRGIELLLERGLPLSLKTVATTVTLPEIGLMRRYAESLGLEFTYDPFMNPRIDCSQSPLEVRLEPYETVALDMLDPARQEEWDRFSRLFNGPVKPPSDGIDEVYHCGGGIDTWAIDPAGEMSICVLSHMDTYNVVRGSFGEGWRTFLRGVRARKATRPTKCTRCHLVAVCGQCPANAELENRDPEEPVDFLCHVTHLRALATRNPVPEHGDCEYCPGGARRGVLEQSLLKLKTAVAREPEFWERRLEPPRASLPMAASGCGTCGSGCRR